jgi:carbamoyl-phosphate synthase large subunit
MPRRDDLKTILVIGAGPIIIGQACEFDYSGTQACKALKEEGYRVLLVNSNPATIMTDPSIADKTFIEPVTPEIIRKIVLAEKPDAILPTVGGQTGLNATLKTAEDGFLEKHGVELIGANVKAIKKAEDRQAFQAAMHKIGFKTTKSGFAHSLEEALKVVETISFPVIIRSSYTLGGTGGAIAYNMEEFKELVQKGIDLSIAREVIIEQSIKGWKEYELEVMRDHKDNVVIVCSIENFDPIGIHTGDSITVAPQQTLPDKEYQELRDMSIRIIREIGVATGGSNIQFAVNPENGEVRIIEMNPRVSRSSALASKATGFPIAKIAAKLAVGYTLDEIANDITKSTPASFEPSIDYVVTKIPRFAFEKFKSASPILGIQMKSVGETMAIGRTFKESFQKAMRGLETGVAGFEGFYFSDKILLQNRKDGISLETYIKTVTEEHSEEITTAIASGVYNRMLYLKDGLFLGFSLDKLYDLSKIDHWYLHNLKEIFDLEQSFRGQDPSTWTKEQWFDIKSHGFSDDQIAAFTGRISLDIRKMRMAIGVVPVVKLVDTCGAEFEAKTPYYYLTYDEESEIRIPKKESIMILGGGPNRIGQGIEFDYMCVHASLALRELGYHTVMVNSNPETVSTDYDISDSLFFEPVTFEDVMNIYDILKPKGVIVQLGGQTPLNLAERLEAAGVPILGTSAKSIATAEDRNLFKDIIDKLSLKQPANAIYRGEGDPAAICEKIGYPVLVRPSYVLGGRAMQIVYAPDDLKEFLKPAIDASPNQTVLIDKYLERAVEIDVDVICDGKEVVFCGIMEHIEEAGIHSGDSACILPAPTVSEKVLAQIKEQSKLMALELGVCGLMNIQFAIKDDELYFLEVNPRGSRTVPFVCKATGTPWVNIAVKIMAGKKLNEFKIVDKKLPYVAVKEAVLPFDKFPDEDTILGPEMKSTGEVMGIGKTLGEAYFKAQLATGTELPSKGRVLVTINTLNVSPELTGICKNLIKLGFEIITTEGTGNYLKNQGIETSFVNKVGEGRPDIRDRMMNREIDIIFNTPIGKKAKATDKYIRILAKQYKIPIQTTIWGMEAAVEGIAYIQKQTMGVKAIQAYYH